MTEATTTTIEVQEISVDLIDLDPANVRRDLGELKELAASIEQQGILQPVTIRSTGDGRYVPIMGNRRCAAARLAGLTAVPAIVRQVDEVDQRIEAQMVENIHRQNLKPSELAGAILYLLSRKDNNGKRRWTQTTLATRLGMSQPNVSKYAAIGKLPKDAFELIDQGKVGVDDGAELAKLVRWPDRLRKALKVRRDGGDLAAAIRQQLSEQEREQKRDRVLADLRAGGVTIAPDNWRSGGVRLGDGAIDADLDSPEAHLGQPCHAAYVAADATVEWICLDPTRHGSAPSPQGDAGNAGDQSASPTASADNRHGSDARAEEDSTATVGEGESTDSGEDEQAAAERDEQARREAAARQRIAALDEAATARWEAMKVALQGKLSRALVQRYISWTFLHTTVLPGYDDTPACDLLGIDAGTDTEAGTGRVSPILDYAAKGDRELDRAVVAVAFTVADEWLSGDWPSFGHPLVSEHYEMLRKLGYEPREVEQNELEQAGDDSIAADSIAADE
jgi:ParB/RepB/Spo0J family partition protein